MTPACLPRLPHPRVLLEEEKGKLPLKLAVFRKLLLHPFCTFCPEHQPKWLSHNALPTDRPTRKRPSGFVILVPSFGVLKFNGRSESERICHRKHIDCTLMALLVLPPCDHYPSNSPLSQIRSIKTYTAKYLSIYGKCQEYHYYSSMIWMGDENVMEKDVRAMPPRFSQEWSVSSFHSDPSSNAVIDAPS